jgi:hypothetical protein
MEKNKIDNLLKGDFNTQENKEQVLPHIEMLAKIWNIPTSEVQARFMREYEDAVKRERKPPTEISRENIDAAIRVLNQILSPEEKLIEHVSTLQEVLEVYRKKQPKLNEFLSLRPEDWAPTGDDAKDTEILKKHLGSN